MKSVHVRNVEVVRAKTGNGYDVAITNAYQQIIKPFTDLPLREALTEASDWAEFFGVKLTPFLVAGARVRPVNRGTYSRDRVPEPEELLGLYTDAKRMLNLNRLMYWQWARFSGIYKNKNDFVAGLLPYTVAGPDAAEWLATNCSGTWHRMEGGYRFSQERDATLYKLFFFEQK
jgi:hypothetical protein